jgi:nicotinate dehydrogenase subunit B
MSEDRGRMVTVGSDADIDPENWPLERRDFLKLVGGGIVFLFSTGGAEALQYGRRSRGYPDDLNAYLRVGADGRITCFTGKIEMGQGIHTSLAQMLAEEMDVPLSAVDMVMGDTALCPYDSGTFGSRSTKYFGPPLRQAGAEAKAVLINMAAEKLGIDRNRLSVSEGSIYDRVDRSKKISYAELAEGQKIARILEQKPPIKPIPLHTVSGRPTDRMDGRAKVTGSAEFTGDIRLPGLMYARILRPPAHGVILKSVDLSKAQKIPGVRIVRDGDFVAVCHKHRDVAEKALALIDAEYEAVTRKEPDNQTIFQHLRAQGDEGQVVTEKGDLGLGKGRASSLFAQSYYNQYVAHAPSEPHTAVAQIQGDKATVWASTQSPFRVQSEAARALGLPDENVRVITPFVGCGFGGKNQGDQVTEAVKIAKALGRPVQVAWSRKEEFFYDTFRPAAIIDIKSGLDSENRICYWQYDNYYAGSRSSEPVYDIPHHKVMSIGGWGGRGGGGVHPFAVGAWRGPGSNTNIFAVESHIDIMAEKAGLDPLSFRLRNLTDERMVKVLKSAADRFGRSWKKTPSGQGYGMACTDYLGTYVATMAEIEADSRSGEVRALRLVCAQDTGEMINPEGIRMQIESCLIMGLGYCLTEEIHFRGRRVLDENFDTYEIPRFSWTPKIETVLVENNSLPPQGCGEPAITTMGAVMANAVYDALGLRMFMLPMTPARIREALKETR